MATASTRRHHQAFYMSLGAGIAALVLLAFLAPDIAIAGGVNVFFAGFLVLIFRQIRKLDEAFLRAHADEEDAPAPFILLVTVAAVAVSAGQLFIVLADGAHSRPLQLVLAVLSVVLGWLAVHTMWAMHYAYEYYESAETSPKGPGPREIVGGLDFPGGEQPNGVAMLYFSYVLGMTAQTSDVNVTSNAMRKLVMLHSIFSFFFNTVIVTAAVNIAISLGQ